jgi:hypothetical protein
LLRFLEDLNHDLDNTVGNLRSYHVPHSHCDDLQQAAEEVLDLLHPFFTGALKLEGLLEVFDDFEKQLETYFVGVHATVLDNVS